MACGDHDSPTLTQGSQEMFLEEHFSSSPKAGEVFVTFLQEHSWYQEAIHVPAYTNQTLVAAAMFLQEHKRLFLRTLSGLPPGRNGAALRLPLDENKVANPSAGILLQAQKHRSMFLQEH